jgi:hypothetical protein
MRYLARAIRRAGDYNLWVDEDVPLDRYLSHYALLYLVGHDAFTLEVEELNSLYNFVKAGGTLFYESCCRRNAKGRSATDAAFVDLLTSFGITLGAIPPGHRLLVEPNLFAAPPPGFEVWENAGVQIAEGIVFSARDYGCLWQGERRDETPSRELIRAAMEWGANLVAYAASRAGVPTSF